MKSQGKTRIDDTEIHLVTLGRATMERINEGGNDAPGGNGIGNVERPQPNRNNTNPNAEIIRGQTFEVGPRYTQLTYIGEGAYGMVV